MIKHMVSKISEPFPAERVLLGLSGSIAVVAVGPGIVWMRQVLGIVDVRVIMTRQASTIVPASTFAALSGNPVLVDWHDAESMDAVHLTVTKWAQVFIVMPATANTLAKAAHGIADDLLSTALLAAECPIVFAPGMNATMWNKPATQRNVAQLLADGHGIVPPTQGFSLADGRVGDGGMADTPAVMHYVAHLLKKHQLRARKSESPSAES